MTVKPVSTMHPYHEIFEQYFTDAAFLWVLRSIALKQPHYLASDIKELEQRIDNNISGLLTHPDHVWHICSEGLELEEPGEVFVAAIIAFRSFETKKIQTVVEVGLSNEDAFKGLVSAIAWLPNAMSEPWLHKFLQSKDLNHKYLAIACLSALRRDPGNYLSTLLSREDCLAHEKLYARVMRLIGELKRKDLIPALNAGMALDSDLVAFWSRWSAILLGNRAIVSELEKYICGSGPFQQPALGLFFRAAPIELARQLISRLAKQSETTRVVIQASAILGDPQVIPWLISQMYIPEFARIAGEAFTQITGINLEDNQLNIDVPNIAELLNNDTEDDNADMDDDENLPWPNIEKLKAVWQKYGDQYNMGQRYFLGKPISAKHLQGCIDSGFQRQRIASSLELTLFYPESVFINLKARIK